MTDRPLARGPEDPLMRELAIVGAGPAGLAAALFATNQRINTVLIAAEVGGQALHSTHVENYMGFERIAGAELVERFETQLHEHFVEYMVDNASKLLHRGRHFELELKSGAVFQSRCVILATGMTPNQLRVPGENQFINRGVSYFADHYGPTAHGKNVLVAGGGNSGLQAVLEVASVAAGVKVVTRHGWTGDPDKIAAVSKFDNLEMLESWNVVRLEGDDRLRSVVVAQAGGDERTLPIDLVFVEIGFRPNTDLVKGLAELNERGEVIVSRENETNVPGLFAAGDCTTGLGKEIAVAVGDGARAALSAKRFIRRRGWQEGG